MSAPPFASFYFDCDSTLSLIEGVEHITAHLSPAQQTELKELTRAAMEGSMPLAQVYEERLEIIAPNQTQVEGIGQAYIDAVTPKARDTIAALQFLGKNVGIISGGLLQGVQPFGRWLGVPEAYIHAVPLCFDDQGAYQDFDRSSPLWQNQGKNRVLAQIPADHHPLAFVGDGITDLETQGQVACFIGFGGVERRARVAAEAEIFIASPGLNGILPASLSSGEQDRLRQEPRFRDLLTAAPKPCS